MIKSNIRSARGFSLVEVMIAVIVLAIGLLSLAALQGELFRSGAEAKARANAATLAQQVIEDARTFGFVTAPDVDYEGNTYFSLDSEEWEVNGVSGVNFTVNRDVERYRFDGDEFVEADMDDDFALATPEFKMVRVSVGWTDATGQAKSVQMSDSIAAISPSDVTKVMEGPSDAASGPVVWIEPPNKDNPRVVPIAVGDDESAASSNPTPQQFVQSDANVTKFSVMTYTGDGDEVLLGRKLEVAIATCICQLQDDPSDSDNPAYGPTIWNGVSLQYDEPETVIGSTVGSPVVANADSEIEPMCTVCCRDHHVNEDRSPAPDPWRASVDGDSASDKYGLASGKAFELLPTSDTGGEYIDSCQLTRVNGRMRMTVDTMQTTLVTAALDADGTGYAQADFGDLFSDYVIDLLTTGLTADAEMPDGYPSPTAKFPGPTSTLEAAHPDLTNPPALDIAEDGTRTLVSFGVYVDYLSDDTLMAYKCALEDDNEDDCAGLGNRNPLSVIPFYAINVASLGRWSSSVEAAISVSDRSYDKGLLDESGGLATGLDGSSEDPVDASLKIGTSNSGLADSWPVDYDDDVDSSANYATDPQSFNKIGGSEEEEPDVLSLVFGTMAIDLKTVVITSNQPESPCELTTGNKGAECKFQGPQTSMTVTLSNYAWKAGKGKDPPSYSAKVICLPTGVPGLTADVNLVGQGTMAETTTITIPAMGNQNYALGIAVVDGATCSSAVTSGLTWSG